MLDRRVCTLLISVVLIFAGCRGSSNAPDGGTLPAPQVPAVPLAAPTTLPPPSSLVSLLRSNPLPQSARRTAFVESDLVLDGRLYNWLLPRNRELGLNGAQLSPNWVDSSTSTFADLAYVTYSFSVLGFDRAAQVRLHWNNPPADFHDGWIALANWDTDCWNWFQGTTDGLITLPAMEPYINVAGDLLCVVLCTGTEVNELAAIWAGSPATLPAG